MSWKSVEMQVALPRTQDAGKLQDHNNKQNQHFQEALAQSQLIQERNKRRKVQDYENVQLKKEKEKNTNNNHIHENVDNNQSTDTINMIKHPYLGNNFDGRS